MPKQSEPPEEKPRRARLTRRLPFRGWVLAQGSDVWILDPPSDISSRIRILVESLGLEGWVDPCDLEPVEPPTDLPPGAPTCEPE